MFNRKLKRRLADLEEHFAKEIPTNLAPLVAVYDVRISQLEDEVASFIEMWKEDRKAGRTRPKR